MATTAPCQLGETFWSFGYIDMVAPHGTGFDPRSGDSVIVSWLDELEAVSPTLPKKYKGPRNRFRRCPVGAWRGEALQISSIIIPDHISI